jgi:quinol monooxygenase YgiN
MGDFTIDSLTEKLCEEFEVTVDEAKNDVTEILKQWQDIGVIEGS